MSFKLLSPRGRYSLSPRGRYTRMSRGESDADMGIEFTPIRQDNELINFDD